MNKNYYIIPVVAIIVFILAIVVTNQMFTISNEYSFNDNYVQFDASLRYREMTVGNKVFKHEMYVTKDPVPPDDGEGSLNLDYVEFSYGGTKYSGKLGDTIAVNDWMSVKIHAFDYERIDFETKIWKVTYYIYVDPDKFLNVNVLDSQQKILNNDNGNLYICNSLEMPFPGSITVIQNYDNSQYDKMYDYNTEYFVGCKNYSITLNPKVLGEFDTKYFPSVLVKEYRGTIKELENENNEYYIDYDISTKHIYSRNQMFYPYISVNEIKYRQSINCKASACPDGYNCIETLYNNMTYNVCMKNSIVIENPLRKEPVVVDCTGDTCFQKGLIEKWIDWIKNLWTSIFG